MASIKQDLAILEKFKFEKKPVGVKFSSTKPDNIKKLDKVLDFCEMLKEAQERGPFYATKDEFTCIGPLILGMVEHDPVFEAGLVGPALEVFSDPRANKRLYYNFPRLVKDTVNCVVFSPVDKLEFDPDILIILAGADDAEILLRAHSYKTGKVWTTRGTPVGACSWLYLYPFINGELYFTLTNFSFGMKSRRLFPEGQILMSIPWDLLPDMLANLKEMEWVPRSFTLGREGHKKRVKGIVNELMRDYQEK